MVGLNAAITYSRVRAHSRGRSEGCPFTHPTDPRSCGSRACQPREILTRQNLGLFILSHTQNYVNDPGSNLSARTTRATHTSTCKRQRSDRPATAPVILHTKRDFYFVRPHCFLSFSTSSKYRGSALALAKRGEYLIVGATPAWASTALFKYPK